MTVRPFDWRDLPALHRYQDHCLFLDTMRHLTQGRRLVSVSALASYFSLATGIFTFRIKENSHSRQVLLAQATHPAGSPSAHLSFLAPESAILSPGLLELLEQITVQMGERGAYNVLAEIDEEHEAFEALRRAGFAIYSRQRIWQLMGESQGDSVETSWKQGNSTDIIGVRSLYCNLVPGLVQQVEPPPVHRLRGLIYREKDEMLAYVEIRYGPQGIWVQPFFHPDIGKSTGRLAHLLRNLPYRRSRPVYICIRSYQSWLEPALENLGAEVGPHQAVMVKRLAVIQKSPRSIRVPALERGQPEVSTNMTQTKSN